MPCLCSCDQMLGQTELFLAAASSLHRSSHHLETQIGSNNEIKSVFVSLHTGNIINHRKIETGTLTSSSERAGTIRFLSAVKTSWLVTDGCALGSCMKCFAPNNCSCKLAFNPSNFSFFSLSFAFFVLSWKYINRGVKIEITVAWSEMHKHEIK